MVRRFVTSSSWRNCYNVATRSKTRPLSSLWPESPKSPKSSSSTKTTVPNDNDNSKIHSTSITRYRASSSNSGRDASCEDGERTVPVIIPYSQSLPSVGYQWCDRCQIRAHAFQKPCRDDDGDDDACAALPAGTICPSAERYFQQQRNAMLRLAVVVFTVPTVVPPLLAALSGF